MRLQRILKFSLLVYQLQFKLTLALFFSQCCRIVSIIDLALVAELLILHLLSCLHRETVPARGTDRRDLALEFLQQLKLLPLLIRHLIQLILIVQLCLQVFEILLLLFYRILML